MEEEKKKINIGGTDSYQQVISESVKVSATQTESEKVTNMVGTFLNEDGNKSLFRRAIVYSYHEVVSEFIRVQPLKWHQKK